MNIKGKIPALIVAGLAWVLIISSCANMGNPMGGPRDSIPPVLVETEPDYRTTNFKDDNVRFTFDEYIAPEGISEVLVVSPPLTKRPSIRTRSKTLIIQFNEELKDSVTYSLDFKNSIVDNNEKNPIEDMRFAFSTWEIFDTLRIAGRVMNAFNLETIEKNLVLLHKNLHDSAVYTLKPDYIAKTDEEGLFMIDNVASGKYHIFAINDANNDMIYNEGAEEIAFYDSIIVPSAEFHEELDTMVKGVDSLLITGHIHFLPDPVYLRQFTEDIFEQYMDSYKRDTRYMCSFIFSESVSDTFSIRLLDSEAEDWYLMENNPTYDSLTLWISDSLVYKTDSLLMEVSYHQLDSTKQLFIQKDTLEMFFIDTSVEPEKRRRRSKEEEEDKPEPIPQFQWIRNGNSTVDLNRGISITAPEPVRTFDSTMIRFYLAADTLKTPIDFTFEKDSVKWRQYNLKCQWEPETKYVMEIDSAACENIYGITSKKFAFQFTTREDGYYGKIAMELTNVTMNTIVQLLKNNEEENVVDQKEIESDGTVEFDFVHPGKYKIKVIFDTNGNGKWDIGSFQDQTQPEMVMYINEVVKIRSNFDWTYLWDITPDLTFTKNIRDKELEEQQRKEAEEKARKERERERNPRQQDGGSNMLRGMGGSDGFIRP